MFKRPLIPITLSYICGIVTAYRYDFAPCFGLSLILIIISLSLVLFRFQLKAVSMLLFYSLGYLFFILANNSVSLPDLLGERQKVVVEGVVLDVPRIEGDYESFTMMVEAIEIGTRYLPFREKARVSVFKNPIYLRVGTRFRSLSDIRRFRSFKNPGSYDYEIVRKSYGTGFRVNISDGRYIIPIGKANWGLIRGSIEVVRDHIRTFLKRNLPQEDAELLSAFAVGDKYAIKRDVREKFNRVGLGHLLAVSGLHIGLIGFIGFKLSIWLMLRSKRLPLVINIKKIATIPTAILILSYCAISGFQISAIRATIMAMVYLFSILIERDNDLLSSLCLSALIILFINPLSLFSISFQLSFVAVLGIILFFPSLYHLFNLNRYKSRFLKKICRYIWVTASITIIAHLALLPLLLRYFHTVSFFSIPLNILSMPILGIFLIPSLFLSSLFSFFYPKLAILFLMISQDSLKILCHIMELSLSIPHCSLNLFIPNGFEIALYYGILISLLYLRRPYFRFVFPSLILIVCLYIANGFYRTYQSPKLKFTFLDVGHGSSVFVRFPDAKNMLIDGGGMYKNIFDMGKNVIAPFLLYSKVRNIHFMVLTHPQQDHTNGLLYIAKNFPIHTFWKPPIYSDDPIYLDLINTLRSKGVDITYGNSIGAVHIGGVNIRCLHPPPYKFLKRARLGINDLSMVFKFTYMDRSILIPGDISKRAELMLCKRYGNALRSDVLLIPHHGSRGSCSMEFLNTVRPKICIISCDGRRFPHIETIRRIRKIGASIYRTDKDGAITITIDGKGIDIKTYTGYRDH